MNNLYVHCYDCGRTMASSAEQHQKLIDRYGNWMDCSCGAKLKLQLTKEDYRKFKLKRIKTRIYG